MRPQEGQNSWKGSSPQVLVAESWRDKQEVLELPVQTTNCGTVGATEIQQDGLDNCILCCIGTGFCGTNSG